MKYSESTYKTLAERFNAKSFLGKVMLIKQTPDLFQLEVDDCSNFFLRLKDEEAQIKGIDMWFEFPQELSGKAFKSVFDIAGINLKTV